MGFGFDAMALDAIWSENATFRFEAVVRPDTSFAFRFPLSYAYRKSGADVSCFEWGVMVDYYPFRFPLFLSLGMFQSAYLFGPDKPEEDHLYLHEIAIGWTLHLSSWCFLEPKLRIVDPTGVFATESAAMRQAMGYRPDVRFSFLVGISFPAPWLTRGKTSLASTGGVEEI